MSEEVKKIRSDFIDEPAQAMRVELDKDRLWELSESIKAQGLINPITVRPKHLNICSQSYENVEHAGDCVCGDSLRFEVVAGHRRFKACQMAGMVEIPCVIRELDDDQMFEIMAAENLERQDVDPVEEAIFISRLMKGGEVSIKDIARKLNRSITWVENRLAILDYPEFMVQYISSGELKLGVAECLAVITDEIYLKQFVDSAVKNGMSVAQARFIQAQWETGCLTPTSEIMPDDSVAPDPEKYRARAICERCGQLAVEPNLKNVFIHYDCPNETKKTE